MRSISSLSLLLCTLSVSLQCWAQAPAEDKEQVRVKADALTYEEQSNTVTATGNVVVTKGETTVTADSVGVNRSTNEVTAQGNVKVRDPRGEIEAETLQLEMENETGTLTNGTVRLPRSQYTLAGKILQKSYGQS